MHAGAQKYFFGHLSCMQERKNISFHACESSKKIFFFVSNAVLNSGYLVMPAKAKKVQKGKAGAAPGGVNFPPPPPPGGNLPVDPSAAAAAAVAEAAKAAAMAAAKLVATGGAVGNLPPVNPAAVAATVATAAANAAAATAAKLASAVADARLASAMADAAAASATVAAAVAAAEAAAVAAAMVVPLVVPAVGFVPPVGVVFLVVPAVGFVPPAGVQPAPAGMFAPALPLPGGLLPTAESVEALRVKLANDRLVLEYSQLEMESQNVLAEQRRIALLRAAGSARGLVVPSPPGSDAHSAILVNDGGSSGVDKSKSKVSEGKGLHGKKRKLLERLLAEASVAKKRKSKSKQDDDSESSTSEDDSGTSEDEEEDEESDSSSPKPRSSGLDSRKDRKRANLLFQHTDVDSVDLQELSSNLAEGDGGSLWPADQARALYEAMASRAGVGETPDSGNKSSKPRRLIKTKTSSAKSGDIPDLLSEHVFGVAPEEVVKRAMKNPYQILPLSVFDPKHRGLFGGSDPLAPKVKHKNLEKFSGTANSLISDLANLISVTCTTDVQFGIALVSLMSVALDLIKQCVDPVVIAEYIWSCRLRARRGLNRGSDLECFLELDHQMFVKCGGQVKANGEVRGSSVGGVGLGPETVPVGNVSKRVKSKVPSHLTVPPLRAKTPALTFAGTTCHAFNSEAGCQRRRCIFKHQCSVCNQSHSLVDCSESGGAQPMLQILDNPNKRVGFGKGV